MHKSRTNGSQRHAAATSKSTKRSGMTIAPVATSAPVAVRTTASQRQTPAPSTAAAKELSRQAIAEAAYFLWLNRGGSDVINWLEAERMLKSRTAA